MNKLISTLLLLTVLWSCQQTKQQDTAQQTDYSAAIDSSRIALKSVMDKTKVPGLSASVSIDGEMVWSEGFGYADLEAKKPVDPAHTLFRIGSVSKTLTATGLALLFEKGLIKLDAEVQTYVPYFPRKAYPITVRQVGGHIAGIRHYIGDEMYSSKFYPSVREGMEIFMNDKLEFEPGTKYHYSSYGWNLISAVMEGATGQDFLTYMKEQVFQPLELHNTHPEQTQAPLSNTTRYYRFNNGETEEAPFVDNSYKWAGGGFISTSEDLIKFGNAHLLLPGFLKTETLQEFIRPQMINDTTTTTYGIGWVNRITADGVKYYGHSGGSVGGITMLAIYPEYNVVVALVSNSSNVSYNGVFHKMAAWFDTAKNSKSITLE
ncbi:MAG: beta-lactamase family protein [Cyclobacteriaceae bacterium]|nr:beta-lactamase family protein [Cyclobacteriaceae bacterium]